AADRDDRNPVAPEATYKIVHGSSYSFLSVTRSSGRANGSMDASRFASVRPRENAHQQIPRNVPITRMVDAALSQAFIGHLPREPRVVRLHAPRRQAPAGTQQERLLR